MFCSKCGAPLPAESVFCFKCGKEVNPEIPSVQTPKSLVASPALTVLLGGALILVVAGGIALVDAQKKRQTSTEQSPLSRFTSTASVPTPTPTPRPTPYWVSGRLLVVRDSVALGPGRSLWYDFTIGNKWRNPKVVGHFEAQGGSGNDVFVVITDDDGLVNFQNRHGFSTWYNSGRATVGTVDRPMPPGNFHLIVSNNFSIFAHKSARLEFAVEYEYLKLP